jgi:ABC-type sugar transport system ATPase subunit
MASITFDHVFKRFGDVTVLNDFDLAIENQEFLVLVGPSGSGKTTALRLLAGLEEISAGNISIGDRVVNDVPPKDRDIAMVFQSYALYFGIRPEDIHDAHFVPRGVDEAAKLSANVTVVEPLGSEVYAYVENGGKELVSRLDPRTSARVGQPLELVVDMGKMHAFERDSGRTLL